MGELATGTRRARSRSAVGLALAALAFPAGAHADDGVPEPELDVQAIVEQVEAGALDSLPVAVELPPTDMPELAASQASEPLVEPLPDPPPQDLPAAEASEAASADALPATPSSTPGDTAQYQPPVEPAATPVEPAAAPEPLPEPLPEPEPPPAPEQPGAATRAPSEWIWVWSWDCAEQPAVPEPTGGSWTWIWTWNCDAPEAVSPRIVEQYQAEIDRYQQTNSEVNYPINFNVAIRIFSPGDDGPVTQVNSAVAAITSLTSTTIEQTIREAAPAVSRPPAQPSTAPPSPEAPVLEPGSLEARLAEAAGPGAKPLVIRPGPTAPETTRPAPIEDRAGWATPTVAAVRAAPALERAAPPPRARRNRAVAGPEPVAPPLPALFGGASVGSSSGAGPGAAFAGFLIALTLAYLVIPPGIAYRVRFAEARMPRGVDLGGDDRPG